ncbi:MAG: GNAT family N-acetyltransferase [Betaproteobacteria bacterium]|nr:MAG: GNAT family N-acetyltransferase [Betaproteobacteria bacterium]
MTGEQSSVRYQPHSQTAGHRLNVDVREACTREEKEKLFRFRYEIKARVSNSVESHDDPSAKRIRDDLDTTAANLFALRESKLVGAIRVNFAWRCALGVHADFYRMRESAGSDHPSRSCIFSRLIVDPASRGNKLGYHLCATAYKHALDRDTRFAFLHCKDDLIYYFSALGFKAYMGRTRHVEYGEVIPMKLDLLDEKYLMMIDSPLLPVLRGWKQSRQPSIEIRPL